ncbi:hypothetical protein Tsubulata_007635, partial [Turnera subulata]
FSQEQKEKEEERDQNFYSIRFFLHFTIPCLPSRRHSPHSLTHRKNGRQKIHRPPQRLHLRRRLRHRRRLRLAFSFFHSFDNCNCYCNCCTKMWNAILQQMKMTDLETRVCKAQLRLR